MKTRIDTETLRALFNYDAEQGVFYKKDGTIVRGYKHSQGYRAVSIKRCEHYLHRLAWQYVHGEVPAFQIDHINGDREDNKLSNLREATQRQNSGNMKIRPSNSSGRKGVYFHKANKKWIANIHLEYKTQYLGSFENKEDASSAYAEAAKTAFGEFARIS